MTHKTTPLNRLGGAQRTALLVLLASDPEPVPLTEVKARVMPEATGKGAEYHLARRLERTGWVVRDHVEPPPGHGIPRTVLALHPEVDRGALRLALTGGVTL